MNESLCALREDDGVIRPGERIRKDFEVPASEAGTWLLEFDLNAHHVAWFRQLGYEPVRRVIRVR